MTIEEFNNFEFKKGMEAEYKGETHTIAGVDFEEKLIGLFVPDGPDDFDVKWVRCENVKIV